MTIKDYFSIKSTHFVWIKLLQCIYQTQILLWISALVMNNIHLSKNCVADCTLWKWEKIIKLCGLQKLRLSQVDPSTLKGMDTLGCSCLISVVISWSVATRQRYCTRASSLIISWTYIVCLLNILFNFLKARPIWKRGLPLKASHTLNSDVYV